MQFDTKVIEVIKRTKDVKSVRFSKPDGFDYLPGQWALVTIGQGKDQKTKPLSLSSSPTEGFLEVTKRLTGHDFSNALNALKVGDIASMHGPFGDLTLKGEHDKVCMLSGGIGITPLRSMIRYSTDKELKASIVLLYSNRFEDSIPFKDDLAEIQDKNPNFRMVVTITRPSRTWKGLTGRIDREMVEKIVPDFADRVFYTCGPKPMVDSMVAMLGDMGLPDERVKYEYFSGYAGAPNREPAKQ